jgi:hypothetical protein
MTEDHVHLVVCRWMRRVLHEKRWSAREWARLAGVRHSDITRCMSTPEDRLVIPNYLTVARLAAVAGSFPNPLRGGRADVQPTPTRRQPAFASA